MKCPMCKREVKFLNGHYSNAPDGVCVVCLKTEDEIQLEIWNYLKIGKVPYSKIYDMGEKRTGCMFCMFGVHLEKEPNRFQRMKTSHPKLYKYCMSKLKCKKALDLIDVKYT